MPSAQLDSLLQLLAAEVSSEPPTIEAGRARMESVASFLPTAAGTVAEPVVMGGVPCEWVHQPEPGAAVIMYLHGGGYIHGSLNTHRPFASQLAHATGGRVLNVGYRLAPESRFPNAVHEATAAYRALLDDGTDPADVVVAGESAGGGLVVAALVAARDERLPMPSGAVVISPWVDLTLTAGSLVSRAAIDPMVTRGELERCAAYYLGGADAADPLASPLYADLAGLPALLAQVGTAEVLYDDAARLVERAVAAGVDARLQPWDGLFHGFPLFCGVLPEADDAIAAIAGFVSDRAGLRRR